MKSVVIFVIVKETEVHWKREGMVLATHTKKTKNFKIHLSGRVMQPQTSQLIVIYFEAYLRRLGPGLSQQRPAFNPRTFMWDLRWT